MHLELLHGTGAESVGGGDEDLEFVLQQEVGDFGEVGGFADAVDADDGDDVGAGLRGVRGADFAEEVSGGGGREDFGEGFLEGGADSGFDACGGY